jgi:hypothetical protein
MVRLRMPVTSAPAGTPKASANAVREVVSCGQMPQRSQVAMKAIAPSATSAAASE